MWAASQCTPSRSLVLAFLGPSFWRPWFPDLRVRSIAVWPGPAAFSLCVLEILVTAARCCVWLALVPRGGLVAVAPRAGAILRQNHSVWATRFWERGPASAFNPPPAIP